MAHARNSGVAAARAPLIAFLDDDEEAPPQWLAGLMQVQAETDADVVFGPVRGRAPESVNSCQAPSSSRQYKGWVICWPLHQSHPSDNQCAGSR